MANVDARGRFGLEGTTELAVGVADGLHLAVTGGAGRLGAFEAAHALVAPSIGYSTVKGGVLGGPSRSSSNFAVSVALPIRGFPGHPEPTRLGGGVHGQLTVRLARVGEGTQIELGPTLGLEVVDGLGPTGGLGGLAALGVVARLVTFDTSFRLF